MILGTLLNCTRHVEFNTTIRAGKAGANSLFAANCFIKHQNKLATQ